MFALPDRDVWVSLDGDVATNWNVWNAASQLFGCWAVGTRGCRCWRPSVSHARAAPARSAPTTSWPTTAPGPTCSPSSCPALPEQPSRQDFDKVGEFRFSDDGTGSGEVRGGPRRDRQRSSAARLPVSRHCPIGGRVLALTVTAGTRRTTRPAPECSAPGPTCRRCRSRTSTSRSKCPGSRSGGNTITEVVEGPSDLLARDPRPVAHAQPGQHPGRVEAAPRLAAGGPSGQDWVAGGESAPAHRDPAPAPCGPAWAGCRCSATCPCSAVGNQVVGETGRGHHPVRGERPVCTTRDLFGVGDDDGATWEDADYRAQSPTTCRPPSTPTRRLRRPGAAAVTLAAGVRAVLPMRPRRWSTWSARPAPASPTPPARSPGSGPAARRRGTATPCPARRKTRWPRPRPACRCRASG